MKQNQFEKHYYSAWKRWTFFPPKNSCTNSDRLVPNYLELIFQEYDERGTTKYIFVCRMF